MAAPQGRGGMCLKFMDPASEVLFVLILSLNGEKRVRGKPQVSQNFHHVSLCTVFISQRPSLS